MTTYRARYVFPVDQPPIENGAVTTDGGSILAVGRYSGEADAIHLGDVAILPGLVNAHTHLEFSDLQRPLGESGMCLPWWVREVIHWRAKAAERNATQPASNGDPVELGLKESARCGVTTISNITTSCDNAAEPALDVAQYLELRALRYDDIESRLHEAKRFTDRRSGAFFGLSPHAPYTVHQNLLHQLCDIATARGSPIAMHLAESPEELQLLATSRGPFRDLLEERGWWEAGAIGLGVRPLDYVRRLAYAPCSMVIHGNYLDSEEIAYLGAERATMAVVYCPRTHAYFKHEPYPFQQMMNQGVRMALGTDSRASNPDLDLRKEIQYVVDRHGVPPAQAIRLGTLNGAKAMGISSCGAITAGKLANLAVLQIPNCKAAEAHELLVDPEARVVATICRGRVVFSDHPALPIYPTTDNS